jgi:HNH endonuclease
LYYGFQSLIRLPDAIPLSSLQRFPSGKIVRNDVPGTCRIKDIEQKLLDFSDAIDDIDGTDDPRREVYSGVRYARDPKIRAAVKRRAEGKCEFCGELGFKCVDGTRYLESHHITALANDGADRMTNVIALCPRDHREAHFGERRTEIEKEMINKVKIAQNGNEIPQLERTQGW